MDNEDIRIEFEVMGLDNITSDFLNWALKYRDNLEFLKGCKVFDKCSQPITMHLDHKAKIQKIDSTFSFKRIEVLRVDK